MQNHILSLTADSIQLLSELAEQHVADIAALAGALVDALMQDHRIFCCGNGSSGCNAQSFASKLGHRYRIDRPALPVILLGDAALSSAIAADGNVHDVFARPLQALARPRDVLLLLSEAGKEHNLVHAARCMQDAGGRLLIITGSDGGELASLQRPDQDIHLRLPSQEPAKIHEAQLFVLNCCCDLIDREFFGVHHA